MAARDPLYPQPRFPVTGCGTESDASLPYTYRPRKGNYANTGIGLMGLCRGYPGGANDQAPQALAAIHLRSKAISDGGCTPKEKHPSPDFFF